MKNKTSSDLLMFMLVLVFVFDLDVKGMNTLHWIGAAVSVIWLVLFVGKLFVPGKGKHI